MMGNRQSAGLPEEAYTGPQNAQVYSQTCPPMGPPGMENGVPLAYQPAGPWAPPGISLPWPKDEYLRDGGDLGLPAGVRGGEPVGVEIEDTIAQYDTPEGKTLVEPSNPVYIYSPRFGAVRQVVGITTNEQVTGTYDVITPVTYAQHNDTQIALDNRQNLRSNTDTGNRSPVLVFSKQNKGALSAAAGLKSFQGEFQTYEKLKIIRTGEYDTLERFKLAQGVEAASMWGAGESVEVNINNQPASEAYDAKTLVSVYSVDLPPGVHKLRVVKVASTPFAKPGDEVDFTIRFDNLGNETLNRVAILDSLSTRLEYVPDSAQCSLDASFSTHANEGDSVALRCELNDPLPPLHGGILRFRCRVR
jgi:uncharacterized repeat protein (TIGR01451 family)